MITSIKPSMHSIQPFEIKTGWEIRRRRGTSNTQACIFVGYGRTKNSGKHLMSLCLGGGNERYGLSPGGK